MTAVAGCLVVAGAVLAVPVGLGALALWWNWLGAQGPGGELAQSLFALAVAGGLGWLAVRVAWGTSRAVWGAVGGPLTRAGRLLVAGRVVGVRPRPVGASVPVGTSPGVPVPIPEGDRGRGGPSPGDPAPPSRGDAAGTVSPSTAPRHRDEPGPQAWLVEELVPIAGGRGRRYATGLVANRGTAKSYLALDLAVALLTGGEWMGRRCARCHSVVYADLELDAEVFRRRAFAVARGRGLDRPPPGLHYVDLSRHTLRVSTEEEAARLARLRAGRWAGLGGWLDAGAWALRWLGVEATWGLGGLGRLALRCRAVGAQVVVLDSLTIGGGVALGDHDGWRRLMLAVERLGPVPVAVDHTDKSGESGMVGSFVKEGLTRSLVKLRREAPGRIAATAEKSNFGPPLDAWTIRDRFVTDATGRLVAVTFTRAASDEAVAGAAGEAPAPPGASVRSSPRPLARPAPPPTTGAGVGRPVLRVVAPPAGAGAPRGHDAVDARVLAAVEAGTPAGETGALAAATGYAPKTIRNARSRLRRRGLLPREEAGA